MSQLNSFIVRCHQKIIDHYKCLMDTASSEQERARFQKRMDEEEPSLGQFIERNYHRFCACSTIRFLETAQGQIPRRPRQARVLLGHPLEQR
jgi:hypothetical protein